MPNEPLGNPDSMGAKLAASAGRPTRTVGYLLLAVLVQTCTLPPAGTFSTTANPFQMSTEQLAACTLIAGRCLALMVLFYGGWHTWLYGGLDGGPLLSKLSARKFNPTRRGYNVWRDVMASTWGTLISAAYEIYILSLCDAGSLELDGYAHKGEAEADGRFLGAHLVRNVALMLIIPYWVEAHFYFGHRALHINHPWAPLYKYIHSFHHKAVNPGPWSGLSMHPLEHLVFFSACLLPLLLPGKMHVLHVIFILTYTRISPIGGHDGYDKPLGGSLVHYLHHTKFTVNYGTPVVPFDVWFGTYDDGTEFRKATQLKDDTKPIHKDE